MRRILFSIGLVIFILLILGFIAPKEYIIERAITIQAPKSHVYERYISKLEGLHSWSKPLAEDPNTSIVYEGTPGTVGSQALWEQGTGIKSGRDEIKAIEPLQSIQTEIRYLRPWESVNQAHFDVSGTGQESTVTWRFEGHSPFPFNVRHLFINMDHNLGAGFEAGLQRLKTKAELSHLEERLYIDIDSVETINYALSGDTVFHAQGSAMTMIRGLRDFVQSISDIESGRIGRPAALVQPAQSDKQPFVMAVPVKADSIDWKVYELAGGGFINARHQGGYAGLDDTHDAVVKYIKASGWTFEWPVRYEFVAHALNQPDTSKWLTLMHYRIREEGK